MVHRVNQEKDNAQHRLLTTSHVTVMKREEWLSRQREQYRTMLWKVPDEVDVSHLIHSCSLHHISWYLPLMLTSSLSTHYTSYVYACTYYTDLHLYQRQRRKLTCSLFTTYWRHFYKLRLFLRLFTLKGYSFQAISLQVYSAVSGSPHNAASIYPVANNPAVYIQCSCWGHPWCL